MTNKVLFSIIVPTYNRAALIGYTIQSLLDQSYDNFEIIIVDDGSTDNTEEIIKNHYQSKVKYYKIKNSERAYARNYGVSRSTGDYINFFDSDDIALPNHLAEASTAIEVLNPEVFHLNYALKNANKLIYNNNNNYPEANHILLKGNNLSCNGVFLRRDVILQNKFNENRALSASEDWELWLRLSARFKIHLIPVITSYIINHDERSVLDFNEIKQISRTNELIKSLQEDDIFCQKFPSASVKIKAHMLSYISLHAALAKKKKTSLYYLKRAIKTNWRELFTRRFLGILKTLTIQ
jgi:glycosyltransferase involved in cell wall biosynthesis